MVGGKAAVEAGAVTHGAVCCSLWLGHVRSGEDKDARARITDEG